MASDPIRCSVGCRPPGPDTMSRIPGRSGQACGSPSCRTFTATWSPLETVLTAIGEIDQFWCLGDIVGYGPRPNECVARLAASKHLAVAGNHDHAAIGQDRRRGLQPVRRARRAVDGRHPGRSDPRLPRGAPDRADVRRVHAGPRLATWPDLGVCAERRRGHRELRPFRRAVLPGRSYARSGDLRALAGRRGPGPPDRRGRRAVVEAAGLAVHPQSRQRRTAPRRRSARFVPAHRHRSGDC